MLGPGLVEGPGGCSSWQGFANRKGMAMRADSRANLDLVSRDRAACGTAAGPETEPGFLPRPSPVRGCLIDVSERKQLLEQLEERLRFETLLSDLSARFINLP